MKSSLISLIVFTATLGSALTGCSKQASSDEGQNVPETATNVPVVTPGANNEVPPGSVPPGATPPGQTSKIPTNTPTSPGAVYNPSSRSTNPSRPNEVRSMPPRVNPNAGPPKAGEQVATDGKIQVEGKTIEIEGVCKLTEEEAICWRPNGDKNEALATELTNAIKAKNDDYSSQFQFKFMKKNRILVLKTTTPPPKPGQGYSGGSSSMMMDNMYGGPGFVEGWNNNNSIFNQTSSTGFDQSRVERQVVSGAFNRETKTFPFRYQTTSYSQERESIPFKKGQFTIDGNTFEITSISDKSPGGTPTQYFGGQPQLPQKMTFITIKAVKITNPNLIANLTPADDSGTPYGGLDDKGNPISSTEFQKIQQEEQKKMMERSRTGGAYPMHSMNRYMGSINLDMLRLSTMQNQGQGGGNSFVQQVNVEASKIKKFSVNKSTRTIYVFDKIKLDKD